MFWLIKGASSLISERNAALVVERVEAVVPVDLECVVSVSLFYNLKRAHNLFITIFISWTVLWFLNQWQCLVFGPNFIHYCKQSLHLYCLPLQQQHLSHSIWLHNICRRSSYNWQHSQYFSGDGRYTRVMWDWFLFHHCPWATGVASDLWHQYWLS